MWRLAGAIYGRGMREMGKPKWPQTPDGVTDWEFVFEDANEGFIPLVMMASSPVILKECATVIVQQLFTREDDGIHVMKYIIDLDEIIPAASENYTDTKLIDGMKSRTADLLREIKADRKKKAGAYLQRKMAGGDKRRS